jgi:hypothetical protein
MEADILVVDMVGNSYTQYAAALVVAYTSALVVACTSVFEASWRFGNIAFLVWL